MSDRQEHDSMGTVRVPAEAYYGAQTQRAVENFTISGLRFPPVFIRQLAQVKKAAAAVNADLGLLDAARADAICRAAGEVMDGKFDEQFVVDLFQTGSGTSTNMNMNEVLASRANEILTGRRGGKSPVHPNDHVNLGQSSNDVIPTVIHLAAAGQLSRELLPALGLLLQTLKIKRDQFADVAKIGRTHLQDAVAMTLGDEFSGYARQIELGIERIDQGLPHLLELALGGTAVGTGINTHPLFARQVIARLADDTGLAFTEAANHFEAQAARDSALAMSGALKTLAAGLVKIAGDIRWLGSGPRCGLGEIRLSALQPGSSIMPGKVNPVIPEAVIQVAYQVMGNDTAILLGGQSGRFELNVAMPLIAYNLLQSIDLLTGAVRLLADKCIAGIEADRIRCRQYVDQSLALATLLVPHIGYDHAAQVAKKAHNTGRTVREVVVADGLLPTDRVERLFGPAGGNRL
ncbi:MAG: aspartate ammonia-lyase [Deltaproteobacteria bacterium]|nr:MAG: aspartate ammonia-lyase [Deltaproteobacteria bacterium]